MIHELFLLLSTAVQPSLAFPKLTGKYPLGLRAFTHIWPRHSPASNLATTSNGSDFLWLPQDDYSGPSFFDNFTFFTDSDPTRCIAPIIHYA
ncbi:hypothetical protein B0H16DRAFT_16075 [Mycena metata]|uniref:Uncharacterized protein n=1 Tax=Mycena metata TaxID=1033252 RepID=A0AAD7KJ66_9AGAR|nr:hypothetical protein B0H16DRAFT_16075 [Mycena metata]